MACGGHRLRQSRPAGPLPAMREHHAIAVIIELPERAAIQPERLDDEPLRVFDRGIDLRGWQRHEARGKIGQQLLQAQLFRQLRLDPLPLGTARSRTRRRALHEGRSVSVFGKADPWRKTVTAASLKASDESNQAMGMRVVGYRRPGRLASR